MQYFGGKAKLASKLVPEVQKFCEHADVYWEPFCGSLNVFSRIRCGRKFASDACVPLIALFRYVQSGGILPTEVSEEDYRRAQRGECDPWYQAFVGFGCSFAGKWFGGYARGHGADAAPATSSLSKKFNRNYANNANNALSRKFAVDMSNARFLVGEYDKIRPRYTKHQRWVIYCDPPYAGTIGYNRSNVVGRWNPQKFWMWAQTQANAGATVLVSEYSCPIRHEIVASWRHRTEIRTPKSNNQKDRVEMLFRILPTGDGCE